MSGAGERGAAAASDGTGQDRRLSSSLTIYIPLHPQDWASWKFILVWECAQAKQCQAPAVFRDFCLVSWVVSGVSVPLPSEGNAAEDGMNSIAQPSEM